MTEFERGFLQGRIDGGNAPGAPLSPDEKWATRSTQSNAWLEGYETAQAVPHGC